jgi:hypothetical protein
MLQRMDPRAPLRVERSTEKLPPPRTQLAPGGGGAIDPGNLLEMRKVLAEQYAGLQWDLGGLAYEMAIRDHFRLDVLVARAGRLQEVDAELGLVEHLLRTEERGAAGSCPSCGALYARGAAFCSQCGSTLMDDPAAPPPAS